MDIITGMDYRNGHYDVVVGLLNVFYLHTVMSHCTTHSFEIIYDA